MGAILIKNAICSIQAIMFIAKLESKFDLIKSRNYAKIFPLHGISFGQTHATSNYFDMAKRK